MSSSSSSDEENTMQKTNNKLKENENNETKLESDLKSLQTKYTYKEDISTTAEEESNDFLLPSNIDWIDYIYYPLKYEKEEDEEKINGGKWLLFAAGDLEKVDHRWIVLQSLFKNGTLVRIKSSTAFDQVKGVTMCYTSNSKNKEEVKRAADEIRKLINYEYLMFYKTNEASALGNYQDAGKKEISIYMHTASGGFYKRDKYKRWTGIQI